jgi:hypothetical protein
LDKARTNIDAFVDGFTNTFAKIPKPDVGLEILKVILDASLFAIAGGSAVFWNILAKNIAIFAKNGIRGAMKDVSNAGIAFAFVASKDMMKAPKKASEQDPMITQMLQNFYNTYYDIQSSYLKSIVNPKTTEDEKHLADLLTDGEMIASLDHSSENRFDDLTAGLQQVLYGKLIPAAWQISTNKQKPFILKADRRYYRCGDPVSNSGELWLHLYMTDDTAKKTSWCDKDGNSWFLLNAVYPKPCNGRACDIAVNQPMFGALDGGDHDTLNKLDVPIEAMIKSSYGGFMQNGNKNGYSLPEDSAFIVDDNLQVQKTDFALQGMLLTPGFFNFTICLDPKEASATIRSRDEKKPICAETPSTDHNSPENNAAGYADGWCGLHVTQWQRNSRDNSNKGPDYQLEVLVKDAANTEIGRASKQVAKPNAGIVADSKLPFDVIVSVGDGSTETVQDSSPICMWYSDQWWCDGDVNHMCNFGPFAGGKREGDCGFNCRAPTDNPPASAARPLPTLPTLPPSPPSAPEPSPTSTDAPPPPPPSESAISYKQGWCGVHIRQYQRRTKDNPSGDYLVEISVYDASQPPRQIAYSNTVTSLNGVPVGVQGELPHMFNVISGERDEAPVKMEYNGENWAYADAGHQCNFGRFDSGHRDGDCGFNC